MRIGIHVVGFDLPGGPPDLAGTLAAVGRAPDAAGLDVLSLMDH